MPGTWVDFKALRGAVTIRQVLDRYGFTGELQEKGDKLVGPCPVHKGKSKSAFTCDQAKGIWNCFSGPCKGGNVLDLVMQLEDCDVRSAGLKLAEWFELSFDRKKSGKGTDPGKGNGEAPAPVRQESERVNPPLNRALTLKGDHPYLERRGLTPDTVKAFGVGYCSRGIMRGRIAIPIHDERGELVAYAGRAVEGGQEPRYRLPNGFSKAHVVWNLHRAKEHSGEGLVVVEGFFDAMKVHQAGFANVVALMGSSLSEQQEELLFSATDRLVLMFDGDDAGLECTRQFYRRLRRKVFLREVGIGAGRQPDDLTDDELNQFLS